jgi:hypothetical protein
MRRCLVTFLAVAGTVVFAIGSVRAAPPSAPQPAQAGPVYPLKLHRPAKVGDKYLLKLNWSRTEENLMTVAGSRQGPRVDQNTQAVDLAAHVEIMEVDPRGFASRTKYVVTDHATIGLMDGGTERLSAGDVVVAWWDGKKFDVSCQQRPLSRGAVTVLAQALPGKKTANGPAAEDIFGTSKRQAVGATWDVNRKAAAADFRRLGIVPNEQEMLATGKLLAVDRINGQTCFKVEATFRSDRFAALPGLRVNLPSALALTEGTMHSAYTLTCPVNPAKRPSTEMESTRLVMTFDGVGGPRLEQMKVVRVIRSSRQMRLIDVGGEGLAGAKD